MYAMSITNLNRLVKSSESIEYYQTRETVTMKLREAVIKAFPALGNDQRYWMFLQYIMFTRNKDKNTGNVLVPAELVKSIGKTSTAIEFLQEFRRKIMHIEWSDQWSYELGECRELTYIAWPNIVINALFDEQRDQSFKPEDRVYFLTGNKVTPNTQKKIRDEIYSIVSEETKKSKKDETKRLLTSLNNSSPRLFTEAMQKYGHEAMIAGNEVTRAHNRHAQEVYDLVQSGDLPYDTPIPRPIRNPVIDLYQQSKPFYKPVANSPRIYSYGASILTQHKAIRKVIAQDWILLDLNSTQFAIAANLWKIDSINSFLASGGSIWDALLCHMADYKATKEDLKPSCYTIINGGSKDTVHQMLTSKLGINAANHFFTHPFIKDVYKASRKAIKQVRSDNGITDVFGEYRPFEGTAKRNNARSLIAYQAHSIEMKLMLPTLDLAESTDQFSIALWLHDGVYIHFNQASRANLWISRIKQAVQDEADRLGVYTSLSEEKA